MATIQPTPVTDAELIQSVIDYMAKNKLVTRGELRRKLNTYNVRLLRLEAEGHFTLPPKLSKSSGATLGRRKSNTCAGWYISRPAPWQSESRLKHLITATN